jgi:triosephosphate isomerase (TIM)
MRKAIVAGNWKMYMNHIEAQTLTSDIVKRVGSIKYIDIVICPPFTSLHAVTDVIAGSSVALGAQNMYWQEKGAYTGEISAMMLLTLGCQYVILGHSERRQLFSETDEGVSNKVNSAISTGLTPIVCVGETREERESGITKAVIERQVKGAFSGLSSGKFQGVIVAYEPVWAIGTGLTATPEQAQEVHQFIRGLLRSMFGDSIAEGTRIQYGGSVKPSNARELFSQPDIDGGLIGGASLEAVSFEEIIRSGL